MAFLAEDAQRLGSFLTLTGLGPEDLRAQAREPRLLAAVLDHLRRDESLRSSSPPLAVRARADRARRVLRSTGRSPATWTEVN